MNRRFMQPGCDRPDPRTWSIRGFVWFHRGQFVRTDVHGRPEPIAGRP